MALADSDKARIVELDNALRSSDQSEMFITPDDDGFYGWYARLLSTLAVLSGEQNIVLASTVEDATSARLVLVTERAAMVADVRDATGSETVPVHIAPLTALATLSVSASMRYDVASPAKIGWPGNLVLEATFEGLTGEVRFEGSSYDRYAADNVGDISHLLKLLQSHLGA